MESAKVDKQKSVGRTTCIYTPPRKRKNRGLFYDSKEDLSVYGDFEDGIVHIMASEAINQFGAFPFTVGSYTNRKLFKELYKKEIGDIDFIFFGLTEEELIKLVDYIFGVRLFKYRNRPEDRSSYFFHVPYPNASAEKGRSLRCDVIRIEEKLDRTSKGFTKGALERLREEQLLRDFTINMILEYHDVDGPKDIIDIDAEVGGKTIRNLGQKDFYERRLRHLSKNFEKDPVRFWRALNMIAQYNVRPVQRTYNVLKHMALRDLDHEKESFIGECPYQLRRARIEYEKGMMGGNYHINFYKYMRRFGVFDLFWPELGKLSNRHLKGDGNQMVALTHTIYTMGALGSTFNIPKYERNKATMYAGLLRDLGTQKNGSIDLELSAEMAVEFLDRFRVGWQRTPTPKADEKDVSYDNELVSEGKRLRNLVKTLILLSDVPFTLNKKDRRYRISLGKLADELGNKGLQLRQLLELCMAADVALKYEPERSKKRLLSFQNSNLYWQKEHAEEKGIHVGCYPKILTGNDIKRVTSQYLSQALGKEIKDGLVVPHFIGVFYEKLRQAQFAEKYETSKEGLEYLQKILNHPAVSGFLEHTQQAYLEKIDLMRKKKRLRKELQKSMESKKGLRKKELRLHEIKERLSGINKFLEGNRENLEDLLYNISIN